MTQEDKELLIRDLSARLPYNIAINCKDEDCNFICYLTPAIFTDIQSNNPHYEYKPYLFPLSSISEEIEEEIYKETGLYDIVMEDSIHIEVGTNFQEIAKLFDILNKYNIDYRGLIPMGLALDATDLNIY